MAIGSVFVGPTVKSPEPAMIEASVLGKVKWMKFFTLCSVRLRWPERELPDRDLDYLTHGKS